MTPVVAINAFPEDFDSEYAAIREIAASMGVRGPPSAPTSATGGPGRSIWPKRWSQRPRSPMTSASSTRPMHPCARRSRPSPPGLRGRRRRLSSPQRRASLDLFEANGLGHLPICIAKTHLSISSDPKLKGAPTGWRLPVREVRASVGAGFIYAICGDMRTMPGLGSHPAAEQIDIDENGDVVGLS